VSMLSLVAALAILAAGIDASFSESESSESEDTLEPGASEVVAFRKSDVRKPHEPHKEAA
jgi:hypothetical protein